MRPRALLDNVLCSSYYVVTEAEHEPNSLIAPVCFSSESTLRDFDRRRRNSSSAITQASRAMMMITTATMMPATNPTSTPLGDSTRGGAGASIVGTGTLLDCAVTDTVGTLPDRVVPDTVGADEINKQLMIHRKTW